MARAVTLDDVLTVVAKHYQVGKDLIVGNSKSVAIVLPRHVAIYLMTRLTDYDYKTIGTFIGGRPFDSITNAIQKVQFKMEQYRDNDALMFKLAGDIRVRAALDDDTEKTPMEQLENVIEGMVRLYTDLQMEAEKQEHEQAREPVDPAVRTPEESG